MLKFLTLKENQNRAIAYLEMGTELFLFGWRSGAAEQIKKADLFKGKTRVNLFLLKENQLEGLPQMILDLYENVYQKDSSKINLYYPDGAYIEEFMLQEGAQQCYNFFVNLWDELVVDGLTFGADKPMEYMFHAVDNQSMKSDGGYGLEFLIPNKLSFYYGVGTGIEHALEVPYNYDYIYYEAEPGNCTFDSDNTVAILKGSSNDIREKFYFVSSGDNNYMEAVSQAGFRSAVE